MGKIETTRDAAWIRHQRLRVDVAKRVASKG